MTPVAISSWLLWRVAVTSRQVWPYSSISSMLDENGASPSGSTRPHCYLKSHRPELPSGSLWALRPSPPRQELVPAVVEGRTEANGLAHDHLYADDHLTTSYHGGFASYSFRPAADFELVRDRPEHVPV